MIRRKIVLMASAAVLAATMAMAGEFEDSLVAQLTKQGYTSFSISRTWLGRTRIVAMNATHRREIILNRHTGEILRDYLEEIGVDGASASGLFDDIDKLVSDSGVDRDDRVDSSGSGSSDDSDDKSGSG